ncbi:MAG: hypothetical protein IIU73_02595, partial [Selenomonadales bacterium]|nr:hypothetical protein [Selenomonadales bacterium]
MKKRVLLIITLVWAMMMSVAVCAPAPLTEADFELGGINAVTDDLETALKNGGKLTCKITVKNNPTIKVGNKAYKKATTYSVNKGKT